MLSKAVFPPLALQGVLLLIAAAMEARYTWFMPADHVALNDEGWEQLPFIILGIGGFIIFMPLHWLVLLGARVSRIPAARLYLVPAVVLAVLVVPLCFIQAEWAFAWAIYLAICFAPYLGFMGSMTWALEAWHRKQERAEQQVTQAFVLSRKQKLLETRKS